jgi:hypothetical protein
LLKGWPGFDRPRANESDESAGLSQAFSEAGSNCDISDRDGDGQAGPDTAGQSIARDPGKAGDAGQTPHQIVHGERTAAEATFFGPAVDVEGR